MQRGSVALAVIVAGCSAPALPSRPPVSVLASEEARARTEPSEETLSGSARGWLGVEVSVPPDRTGGVLVQSVLHGSPAERAGLLPGDRMLKLDGALVSSPSDVVRIVSSRDAGARVAIVVRRANEERLLAAELVAAPDETGVLGLTYVGQRAPSLDGLETVQGSVEPTNRTLAGKVVVLEFWAPWCTVCRFLVPRMNEWHARYAAQGVVVLGVTMDAVVPASTAASQLGIEYPVASDHDGKTTRAYRARAIPTLFVIDKAGVVRDVQVGYSAERLAELEALLARLIDEPYAP
ncbi:MAG: redoxin domain-containing protein [Polyangiaceae bacterium]